MTKGQKKYLFLVSPLLSLCMSVACGIGAILAWTLGQMTFNYYLGSPDDGFVSNVYYTVIAVMGYWWVALISPALSLFTFGFVEFCSRKSTQQ
jgi:hypothetical protein